MSWAAAGRITCVSTCHGTAPRFRATANQLGSIFEIPLLVEKMIGQIDAAPIRKTIAPSQVEKAMTAIGIQESGLIMRSSWKGALVTFCSAFTRPIRTPIGIPSRHA